MEPLVLRRISDRAYWDEVAQAPAGQAVMAHVARVLEAVPARLPMPTAADYLAAKRANNRSLLDQHWRNTRPHLAQLVVHRLLSGMGEDDRLLNWIFDYTFEPTWMVSAHLPENDLPKSGAGQLDLAGAEMAAELAELREVLLPWLQGQSSTLADSIVSEIDRRCLVPFVTTDQAWWAWPHLPMINNWTGVCGGSLLTACLSLEAQGFARPEARQKAIEALNLFFRRAFTDSGECDEGPGYWNYGMEFACLPLMRMSRQEIEKQFDANRIRQIAGYLERAHLQGDCFFAANDSGSRLPALGFIGWLAEFADSDFLRWFGSTYHSPSQRTVGTFLRSLALTPPPAGSVSAPALRPARFLPDQQVALFQRRCPQGVFTFTCSGGHNAESHNHNDLGTFQVMLEATPWIPDLGIPHYQTEFFGPLRYEKYLIASSAGHCCPRINGVEQQAGAAAAAKVLAWEAEAGRLALDLTAAYPREAGLEQWVREAVVGREAETQIVDRFTLRAAGEVIHRIWFWAKPTLEGAVVRCGPVSVQVDGAAWVELREFACDDPSLLMRDGSPEGKVYRVDWTYACQAGETLEVRTKIRVG